MHAIFTFLDVSIMQLNMHVCRFMLCTTHYVTCIVLLHTCPSSTISKKSDLESGLCQSVTPGMEPRYCGDHNSNKCHTLDTYMYIHMQQYV